MNLPNLDPKKRERYLMLICGVMFLVALVPVGYYLFGSDVSQMKKKIAIARENIEELEAKRLAGLKYERQIKQNAADALPTDTALAAAEYKNWLTTLATASRFEGVQVNNTGTTPMQAKLGRGQTNRQGPDTYYTNFKFSVSGKTTLNDLGRFLQQFYAVKTPHLIRSMSIKPIAETAQRNNAQQRGNAQQAVATAQRVDVTMNIEAISIPQTTNQSFEARLKEGDETNYGRMIAALTGRDFFSPFTPERPPQPPPPPPVVAVPREHTYLSGVTWSNDRGQAWFNFRLEGRIRIFKVGDNFRVGTANCTIEAINLDNTVDVRVEARSNGQLSRTIWRLKGKDTFLDAQFLRDIDEEDETVQQTTATVNEVKTGSEV